MAIHWCVFEMNRYIFNGHRHRTMAGTIKTRFFSSVCVLVSRMASPKQPQSVTGLNKTNHRLTNVMPTMNTSIIFEQRRRRMAKSMKIPRQNSTAASTTDVPNVSKSGTTPPRPMAVK